MFGRRYKKAPCPVRTEGVNSRGTTSGSASPHDDALTASDNASRYVGRPRPPLLLLQAGHSGRYFSGFSHCLAPTGSSLAEKGTLTSSLQRVCQIILANIMQLVKNFIESDRCEEFYCTSKSANQFQPCWPVQGPQLKWSSAYLPRYWQKHRLRR